MGKQLIRKIPSNTRFENSQTQVLITVSRLFIARYHIARSSPRGPPPYRCGDPEAAASRLKATVMEDLSTPAWFRAVEADLGQQNIGLASAWRKAAIRDDWRRIFLPFLTQFFHL